MEEPFVKISRSPLNNSHAKMLYTFPKAIRFRPEGRLLYPSELQQLRQNLRAGVGAADPCHQLRIRWKVRLHQEVQRGAKQNAEEPATKQLQHQRHLRRKGQAWQAGHTVRRKQSEMESTGPLSQLKRNTNPGPGSYRLKSMLSKSTYSFSSAAQIEDKQLQAVPGPGEYDPKTALSPKGVYSISRFRASRAMSFTANRKSRFSERKNFLPGPGEYQLRLKNSGKQVFSKYKSCLGQSFPHSPRPESLKQSISGAVPGPGQYQHITEFGSRAESRLARCLSSRIAGKENLPISR